MSLHIGDITQGNGDKPRMELHTTTMTLLNSKCQRVIAGRHAMLARKNRCKRLYRGGIDDIAADASLKQNRIYMDRLQAIKHCTEMFLLGLDIASMSLFGPIEPLNGGEPHSSILTLRSIYKLGITPNREPQRYKQYQ
jgi:hypothetical protein